MEPIEIEFKIIADRTIEGLNEQLSKECKNGWFPLTQQGTITIFRDKIMVMLRKHRVDKGYFTVV